MAIKIKDAYPGQHSDADPTGYPDGAPRNDLTEDDGTGTPLEQQWVRDWEGFKQAVLTEGNVEANGTPDKVGASQILEALQKIFIHRRNRYTTIGASASFEPPKNATRLDVFLVGGGGSSGAPGRSGAGGGESGKRRRFNFQVSVLRSLSLVWRVSVGAEGQMSSGGVATAALPTTLEYFDGADWIVYAEAEAGKRGGHGGSGTAQGGGGGGGGNQDGGTKTSGGDGANGGGGSLFSGTQLMAAGKGQDCGTFVGGYGGAENRDFGSGGGGGAGEGGLGVEVAGLGGAGGRGLVSNGGGGGGGSLSDEGGTTLAGNGGRGGGDLGGFGGAGPGAGADGVTGSRGGGWGAGGGGYGGNHGSGGGGGGGGGGWNDGLPMITGGDQTDGKSGIALLEWY